MAMPYERTTVQSEIGHRRVFASIACDRGILAIRREPGYAFTANEGPCKVLAATTTALTILVLLFPGSAAAGLNHWTGTRSWNVASRAATIRALALLVIVFLVLSLNPEVRPFLLFLDWIGVDIFLMLLFFQGREILHWLNVAVGLSLARRLAGWGWYPMPLPHRALFKQHPWWGIYATVQPMAVAFMPAVIMFVVGRTLAGALNKFL